ncbi:MAG: ABC transporter permease [Coprobacillaceae bacterium]
MLKYIAKRLLLAAITILVITFILYLMLEFMPGSPFNDEKLTQAQKDVLYAKYGLDQPFIIKFKNYLIMVFTEFDFGVSYSIQKNADITTMLAEKVPISIRIGVQAIALGSITGLLLGILAALKHNTWLDTFSTVLSVIGVSVPAFVFALGLQYFIGFKLGAFPLFYNSTNAFSSSVLPSIALSMMTMATVARFARSEMIDVLNSEYMLLAESKGLPKKTLIFRHALRNALIPVITVLGPLVASVLTGSLVVEKIFSIPGIGSLLVQGIQTNDYNVTIACALIYSILYIIVMLVVDNLYGVIDPRIR